VAGPLSDCHVERYPGRGTLRLAALPVASATLPPTVGLSGGGGMDPLELVKRFGSHVDARTGRVGAGRPSQEPYEGFRHFWAADFESCVHVTAPKVEAAARSQSHSSGDLGRQ